MSETTVDSPRCDAILNKEKKTVANKETTEAASGNQSRTKCQIIHLVNPNSEQKKQDLATSFEPLLTALEKQSNAEVSGDKVQYYVEVGGDEVLNLKDGVQYTLVQTDENSYQLCETLEKEDGNRDDDGSWSPIISVVQQEDDTNEENVLTPAEYNTLKALSQSQKSTPCQGQGDETGNILVESSHSLLNADSKSSDYSMASSSNSREEVEDLSSTKEQSIYTTLEKHEIESCVNYETPRNVIGKPLMVGRPPAFMEPFRFAHPPPRILYTPDAISYNVGIRSPRCRLRKPRPAWHPYPTVMHSTPLDTSNRSIENNGDGSDRSIASGSSMSLCSSSCSDSQDSSLEYPRVPNNTPNTVEQSADSRTRGYDPLWFPKVSSQLENLQYYVPMDLRESHNQKERRRRQRIKLACQTLRNMVPGINERTDKATVFEHVVRYLSFIKHITNNKYDEEFIESCYM